jgi:2-hydroxychromene-2-carboxylate isomerase
MRSGGRRTPLTKQPIEFFFDPVSPYSYLATTQINALAERHDRKVVWHPTLVGITVVKIMGLKPVPQTPMKSVYSWLDAQRQAEMLGVPLKKHGHFRVNSLAASRAYLWLKDRDEETAQRLITTLSAQLWTDGIDITEPNLVIATAQKLGVDTTDLTTALADDTLKEQLKQAFDYALSRNVFGVPYFIVDDQPLWGVDRLWLLEHWLEHGSWPRLFRQS